MAVYATAPEIYTDTMNDIKVSICTITYNHGNYIRQTLEGVVSQKTNFNLELLIHDDASTDNTAKIILEYQKKYPHIIKPILQPKNLMSKGVYVDQTFNWPRIKGKYVAYLDGDDYWTDPYKLQKQVDFLDAHPYYSIVFHPVKMIWEKAEHREGDWGPTEKELANLDKAIWHNNFIATLSVMYRWRLGGENISLWPFGVAPGDWYVHLLHAQTGKIGYIAQVMGVYRKHSSGVWYHANASREFFTRYFWPRIHFCECAKAQFNKDFTFIAVELLAGLFNFCNQKKDYSLAYELREQDKQRWQKLNQQVTKYLGRYPSANLFFCWLRYKLAWGQKRKKYKKHYRFYRTKNIIEKINKEL